MIIITENNYKPLNDIQKSNNPEREPNVVFYPTIFIDNSVVKITKLLGKLKYGSLGHIWFADNSKLTYDKNLVAHQFPSFLEDIRSNLESMTGFSFNSCLVSKYYGSMPLESNQKMSNQFDQGLISPTFFFGENMKLVFTSKIDKITKSIDIPSGSLLIERHDFSEYWRKDLFGEELFYSFNFKFVNEPENFDLNCERNEAIITECIPTSLKKIYLDTRFREKNAMLIKYNFRKIHKLPYGEQCILTDGINILKRYIKLGKLLGTGDWGNVYSACTKNMKKFALKMSRITKNDLQNPYSDTSCSWYETWILRDIFRPLIVKNICPNLPLFIDTFLCDKCEFIFRKGDKSHPCVITAVELASGDFKDYLKFGSPTEEELYSALFQVMAGLYGIQMSGQILNNDIKSSNILYYDVTPGGYWHYKIDDIDFYVPNYGKMFVLNDFGVSTIYNPNFQLYPTQERKVFNLGSRYAINMDGIFSPIKAELEFIGTNLRQTDKIKWVDDNNESWTSNGATYKLDRKTGQIIISRTSLTSTQKSFLFRKGVTTNPKNWNFFENPSIIPPFEFYNDTQDILRTFVGGKRTTQKGNHILYPSIPKSLQDNIKPYLGSAENSKKKIFSPYSYHVLAGDFMKKFFTETYSYRLKPKGIKISYYNMNKCLKSGKNFINEY